MLVQDYKKATSYQRHSYKYSDKGNVKKKKVKYIRISQKVSGCNKSLLIKI